MTHMRITNYEAWKLQSECRVRVGYRHLSVTYQTLRCRVSF